MILPVDLFEELLDPVAARNGIVLGELELRRHLHPDLLADHRT